MLLCTLTLENIRPIAIFRCKIRRFFAIFSKTTQDTETLYTSFESSNIQLLGARRTGDVVIPYDSQNPLIETRTFFTKRGVADLFEGPRPLSLGLQRAAYYGFPMRYITTLEYNWFWIYSYNHNKPPVGHCMK